MLLFLSHCKAVYEKEAHAITKADLIEANPKYGLIDKVDEQMPEFSALTDGICSLLCSIIIVSGDSIGETHAKSLRIMM